MFNLSNVCGGKSHLNHHHIHHHNFRKLIYSYPQPCQALFVAPCSHVWHYKCIKPLVDKSYPTFLCPNCRAIADLGKDIEEDELYQVMRELEQENQNRAQDTPSEDDEGGDEQNPELDRLDEGESAVGDALTEVGPRNDEDGTGSNLDYQQHLPSSRASDTREQQSTPTREQQRNRQQQYQDSQTPLTTDDSDEGPGRIGTGGPMTPMNDAGPFVFDGEGPRNLGSRGRRESRG